MLGEYIYNFFGMVQGCFIYLNVIKEKNNHLANLGCFETEGMLSCNPTSSKELITNLRNMFYIY